ncbi:MAG: YfiR family protein [Candidatus Thiodiazotropha sp. (ex Dulcina madagascariensis)]|nr:YfiR family protein [Candidatus Thiodiazotropha sp. (ex Dulcina madagascariensis)]
MRQVTTRLLICAALCLLTSALPGAIAQDSKEEGSLLKAAFIYNFAKFTRWPDSIWRGKNAPLTFCSVGDDKLVDELERLSGKTIKGRPVTIRPHADSLIPGSCQVLYIAVSMQGHYDEIIESLRGEPVLTVSELPQFAHSGGIVELYRKDGRVRFIINLRVAREAGLELSSRLLNLARVVGHEDKQ